MINLLFKVSLINYLQSFQNNGETRQHAVHLNNCPSLEIHKSVFASDHRLESMNVIYIRATRHNRNAFASLTAGLYPCLTFHTLQLADVHVD